MEKINFNRNRGNEVSANLDEGVKSEYFYSNIALEVNAKDIETVFMSYGYNLSAIPGHFVKAYTMNEKELAEVRESLEEIQKFGLKDIFAGDLKLAHFKRVFIERVRRCIEMNVPFLNSDNTIIKELNTNESFNLYLEQNAKTATPTNIVNNDHDEVLEARIASMDEFEASIYNSIAEKLNYLILANATNYNLVGLLKLAIRKFAEAILDRGYELPKEEMLAKVISELGLDIESPEAELILNAVADIQISVERGRVA